MQRCDEITPAPKRKFLPPKPFPKTALKNHAHSATVRAMLDDRSYMRANPHRSRWSATVTLLVKEASAFSFRSLTNTMCLSQGLFIALASRLELDLDQAVDQGAID